MDDLEEAAMAAAASMMGQMQGMSKTFSDLFDDGNVAGGKPWDDEEDEVEEFENENGKRTRESRPRPQYHTSAWGARLALLESLRKDNRLHQNSREAKAFRSDFRVPYEFFLSFVDW